MIFHTFKPYDYLVFDVLHGHSDRLIHFLGFLGRGFCNELLAICQYMVPVAVCL